MPVCHRLCRRTGIGGEDRLHRSEHTILHVGLLRVHARPDGPDHLALGRHLGLSSDDDVLGCGAVDQDHPVPVSKHQVVRPDKLAADHDRIAERLRPPRADDVDRGCKPREDREALVDDRLDVAAPPILVALGLV